MQRQRVAGEQVTPNEIVRFVLTADLAAGADATAYIRIWDRVTDAYVTTGIEITIYDADGRHSGGTGDKGRAIYARDSRRWEVLSMETAGDSLAACDSFWGTTVATATMTSDDTFLGVDTTTGCLKRFAYSTWLNRDKCDTFWGTTVTTDTWNPSTKWIMGVDGSGCLFRFAAAWIPTDACDTFWGTTVPTGTPDAGDKLLGVDTGTGCLKRFPWYDWIPKDACDAFWDTISEEVPTDADFVVGIQDGCLVKFPISECP